MSGQIDKVTHNSMVGMQDNVLNMQTTSNLQLQDRVFPGSVMLPLNHDAYDLLYPPKG